MPTSLRLSPLSALRRSYVRAAILLLVSVIIYSPLLWHAEFFWDDFILLVDNPLIKSSHGLFDLWFSTRTPDYFPLTSTTFWLEWRLWGMHAEGYHLTNILLHAGSALLLWRIFLRLRIPGAALIALLFAIHPVNVESVAWIAERKNTLSLFLVCGSLLLYLRSIGRQSSVEYVASIICFFLALLAKTAVVMFPFVLLLLAWWKHRRLTLPGLLRSVPFFALSLLLGLVTVFFQYHRSISDIVVRDDGILSRLAIAGQALWFYIGKLLFPLGITFNYPRWTLPAHGLLALLPLTLLLLLFLILWQLRHTCARPALIALAAYTLMLLPMLGFLNIFFMRYSLVSDHWQYHATPILLALIVPALLHLTRRLPRRLTAAAATLLIVLLTADSFSLARIYQTPESVWQDTLAHNPASWLAHAQLGDMYLTEAATTPALLAPAIDHLAEVVHLQPQRALGYVNLANAYVRANQPTRAAQLYTQGLAAPDATANDRARLYQGLGSLEAKAGHYAAAEPLFQQAFHLNPDSFTINFYLALTLAYENKREEAQASVARALAIDPTSPTAQALARQLETPPPTQPASP
jgi:tetratricopeptide (TPR) repeat protein